MRFLFVLILVLQTVIFCQDENIIAQINDRVITKEDFILRSEYTIRPSYCKSNNQIHKKIILNSLIAEKLMALEVEPYISTENFSDNFLTGIKEQYMRDYLLKDKVYSKIEFDSEINKQYLKNSTRTYTINFLAIASLPVANSIDMLISQGIEFETICFDYLNLAEVPQMEMNFFYEKDPAIHEAIFLNTLFADEVLGPIVTKDNKRLFVKIESFKDNPLITSEEITNHTNLVNQRLYELSQIKEYDDYIREIMKGSNVVFNNEVFVKLASEAYDFYIDRNNLGTIIIFSVF